MNDSTDLLQPSARLPVLFLGHGSPMNVIEDNEFRRGWQALGAQFGAGPATRWPWPRLILCISAHWLTRGWWLTAMERPPTIHDFGGFPRALFEQQYPAPGAPDAARAISALVRQPDGSPLGLDTAEWGLDHGAWGVLKPMFPQADIPVIQLGMDYSRPPAEHYAIGQQLRGLRERGVLIVGSGNTVHNLRAMERMAPPGQAHDWALEFDHRVARHLEAGQHEALLAFREWGAVAELAHPSWEHFLPLVYAAGAAGPEEPVQFFNASYQGKSVAMRCVVWD